jgi:hypothetical protein
MAEKKTGFDKFLEDTPRRAEFVIAMVADSTNEVTVDIDTALDDGQAWLIYGMEYGFENVDPTIPLPVYGAGVDVAGTIQVHRNTESDILLASNNNRLMAQHKVEMAFLTSGMAMLTEPYKVPINTVTLQPTLRVIYRTSADNTNISAATAQISGVLLYDIISAPPRLSSKIGTLTDL